MQINIGIFSVFTTYDNKIGTHSGWYESYIACDIEWNVWYFCFNDVWFVIIYFNVSIKTNSNRLHDKQASQNSHNINPNITIATDNNSTQSICEWSL